MWEWVSLLHGFFGVYKTLAIAILLSLALGTSLVSCLVAYEYSTVRSVLNAEAEFQHVGTDSSGAPGVVCYYEPRQQTFLAIKWFANPERSFVGE